MFELQTPAYRYLPTALFSWLFCLLILITGCEFSLSKTAEEYLSEAYLLHESQQNREAIIALKNSLQKNPNSTKARVLLGKIYTQLGEAANAEKELNAAISMEASLQEVALYLGDAMLMQGDSSSIFDVFDISEKDSSELRARKAVILGEAALQARDFELSAHYFDIASKETFTQSRALLGQAMLALFQIQLEDADLLMQQLLETDGENPRAWLVKADIMRAQDNSEGAIEAFNQAIQFSHPNDFFFQVAVREKAYQQLKSNNPQQAKKSLELLKVPLNEVQFGDDSKLVHALAVIAFEDKKYDQAYELAEKILILDSMHPGALLLCGSTAAIQGNYLRAESHLERFIALFPDHQRARKILAFVQAKNQRYREALDTLNYLVENSETLDPEMLALAGVHSLEVGDFQASSVFLQEAVSQIPEDSRLRFALAENLAERKEFNAAIDQLASIQHGSSKVRALFAIAELRVAEKKFSESLETLEKIKKLEPENPMPLVWQGVIFNRMNEPVNANEILTKALALDRSFYPALRTLAIMAIRSGDMVSAEGFYKQAIENNPDSEEALHDYANFLISQQKIDDAEAMLIAAQSMATDSTRSIVSLARLYLSQSMPDKAMEILLLEAAKGRVHPAIYAELGNAQRFKGDLHGALSSYKKLADKKGDSHVPHYLVATVQLALEDFDGAEESLSKSLSKDAFFAPALVAAAQLSLRKKDVDSAREKIERLQKSDPKNAAVPLLNASLAAAESDFDLAAKIYRGLYNEQPSNFVLQNLVNTLWRSGDKEGALKVLNEAVVMDNNNIYALYLLGSAEQNLGDITGAVSTYQRVISLNSQHYQAYHKLANLLRLSEPQKALVYAEKAYHLQPNNSSFRKNLRDIKKMVEK